jgi:uncharacterized protein YoxC
VIQADQPFFGNNLEGALKFFGSLIAFGGLIIGIVVKMGQTKFAEDIKEAKLDITNLGIKVDGIDKGCIEQTAKLTECNRRVDRQEVLLQGVIATQGEQKAGIEGINRQMTSLQSDMTALITSSSKAISDDVHNLALKVERLGASKDERDRIGLVLEKILTKKNIDG